MSTTIKLIGKTTLTTTTADVTFSDIPGTHTDLLLVLSMRSNRSAAFNTIKLRFNGASTDTNHSGRYILGDGSNASSGPTAFVYGGDLPAANATSNTFGSSELYIPNYAGSANKSISLTSGNETNATTAYISAAANLWADTAAITSIRIFQTDASSFVSGSSAFLYGITRA